MFGYVCSFLPFSCSDTDDALITVYEDVRRGKDVGLCRGDCRRRLNLVR